MEDIIKFSGRELDVMNVFWEEKKPLIAKEIVKKNSSLSINTVQAVLKTLLKKGYIKVADIVYSGTVLTRSYETVLTSDEYIVNQITKGPVKECSFEGVMVTLLNQEKFEEETIEKLESLLQDYKNKLKQDI